ncbi:MAG: MarR family transcriptional regulator [Clostridia bacterium]|nr:MarR family transcriptional regulator [Clostridia bacterium]
MIEIKEPRNEYAKKLMRAFSQFRKIHWRPPHVQELKPSEFRVLHTVKMSFIDDNEDGLMVSEISDRLKVARPTVTQLVNSLQKKGILEKKTDENDGRVVRIHLSDKGKEMAKKGAEEFYALFKGLVEHLGPEKSDELANLLTEVFEYFETTQHMKG